MQPTQLQEPRQHSSELLIDTGATHDVPSAEWLAANPAGLPMIPPTPPSGQSNEPSGSEYTHSYSSSGDVVDVEPRVTAMPGTQEHERQMEELNRWRISRRHEKCVVCFHVRDPTDWNGRCRWCGAHVCSETCFLQHDVECEERPPRDGGRDPEEVHDDLDASEFRDTPDTPIFRDYESVEVARMLRYRIEQCYDGAPRPLGFPFLMSRNLLIELLRGCAEQVAQGRAGRAAAESFEFQAGERSEARPTPPPP